jgi:hypothetical protein
VTVVGTASTIVVPCSASISIQRQRAAALPSRSSSKLTRSTCGGSSSSELPLVPSLVSTLPSSRSHAEEKVLV